MISMLIPATVFWVAAALVVYHHAVFPLLAKFLARFIRSLRGVRSVQDVPEDALPRVAVVVPAFNEEKFIAEKIANLAELDYPSEKLEIIIASDGSSDDTVELAKTALKKAKGLVATVKDFNMNRGKIAVLNEIIPAVDADIVVLSDVSAVVGKNAIKRLASHFANERVGVVSGTYQLDKPGSEGERLYWNFQTALKRDENTIGAIMGAHGAFYAIRGGLFKPLEADTINDDFIIPMRIVGAGYESVYDTSIVAREREQTQMGQDYRRRVRMSAGGMQQIVRLMELFNPVRRPGVAFVFASGKALRTFTPFLLAAMLLTSLTLTLMGEWFYALPLLGLMALIYLGYVQIKGNLMNLPKILRPFAYLAAGHMAGLVGGIRFLARMDKGRWGRASDVGADQFNGEAGDALALSFLTPATQVGKRTFDIVVASAAFIVFAALFPFIALLIKLDSRGPIFYRQLRVGTRTETESRLFLLTKFRTMRTDAESKTGAVWASKNDPRITRFGGFMRKTRLDEFPQCLNVLAGDMSIVGPRPERPAFFAKLEREIPFYTERTYGLRPGITGLAQVTTGYDESVEDVREKVLHDHVYATRLGRSSEWFWTDVSICFKTFTVMVLGKGQ
ncbi:MAG: sugar transferase [Hyphomicrobiales bacterium]